MTIPSGQVVKCNGFLVCRSAEADSDGVSQCKAVCRSGAMECHDTMSSLVMECHEEVVTSQVDSTWNVRCAYFQGTRCRQATLRGCQQRRISGTTEIPSGRGAVKQPNVKAWKATHFRSETESLLKVDNKNRSRCGHMSTVTGKGSLEDPLRCEDSSRVDQLNYFEKVLENSMASSEQRLEQLRRVGSRATRRMATITGSTAAVKRLDSNTSIILQKHRAREEPIKLRAPDYVERET